jgi:hypothetical protein
LTVRGAGASSTLPAPSTLQNVTVVVPAVLTVNGAL